MKVANGTTDVTTYFVLRDSTNHAPKTDVTVTDIDLYYVEELAAISSKVDATALAAADSAHSDNKAYHVGQGLYRIDWPDTCFNGGVGKKCILIVVCSGVDTTFLEVELTGTEQTGDSYAVVSHADYGNAKLVRSTTPANTLTVDANHLVAVPATQKVDVDTIKTQAVTCAAGVTVLASVGTAATSTAQTGDSYAIVNGDHGLVSIQDDVDAIKAKTDLLTFEAVTNHIEAAVQNITNDAITAASINTGAFTADAFAADAIVAATLATGAITADAFAADAIVAATLATGALTSDAFAAGAITNAAVADDVDVNVKTMTAGVITATVIADNAIDLATFAADCKTGSALKANVETITAGAIAAASLNADMDTELATIIWNAATASYGGAGTYGQAVEDILADTNELQVDDTPTAIAAIATTLGVAGAGLTALPWNAAWDTEVQSECTDALNAYDPPTKAELDTAQGAVVVSAAGIDAIFDRNSTLSLSFETLINRTYQILNNAMTVNETTGVVALKAIGGASDIASGDVDSAAGVTDRDELTWS